jgi:NAD-dependent dihydropyrimidine dehydrogenase PreA subunit
MIRDVVEIDEAKCDGCGECIPSCAEGALYLDGGKVKLKADALCDGLGACLGECPKGALRVAKRDAAAFDEGAVLAHQLKRMALTVAPELRPVEAANACPGSRPRSFAAAMPPAAASAPTPAPGRARLSIVPDAPAPGPAIVPQGGSKLGQWPVQLQLVPPHAPFLRGADLLVTADCVPFAYAGFHAEFLAGRRVLVGCPKLDDVAGYAAKLEDLFRRADPKSVTVVKMEVPCCAGIAQATRHALARSGATAPLEVVTVGIGGAIVERV